MTADLLLMQVTDSTFPIGAYAHSFGLETYVTCGVVADESSAERYVRRQLAGPLTYTELLGMRLAFERAGNSDVPGVLGLEATIAAHRVPRELREASQRLAARFCRMVPELLDEPATECFARYADAGGAHAVNVAYGVFAQAAGISLEDLLRRYLYTQVSAMVTTCVKAVPLSQTAGQRILRQSYESQQDAVARALAASEDDLCRSFPGFDIRSIEHETLYTRLYMS